MKYTKLLVSLVAVFALVAIAANVSAFGTFQSVKVNNVEALSGANIAVFSGDKMPVEVTFIANANAIDARVKVWISGDSSYSYSSDRFDVLANGTYSRTVLVQIPADLDPSEALDLEVSVESRSNGIIGPVVLNLAGQRESYNVEILDVSSDTKVEAGNALPLDIVLKNRGRHQAEDTFVTVSIPALGIEKRSYFGDLSAIDQSNPDKEDAVERRMFLSIPSSAPAGIYLVEVHAFNADSESVVTRKVAIVGASDNSMVVSSTSSKTVNAGEKATYSITLVNSGDKIRVYDLVFDSSSDVTLEADDTVVAIPAGSSRTVKFTASSDKEGKYNVAVNVNSDGELVKAQNYVLTVNGTNTTGFTANATVLLTVVLAIIFIVLLVVLIVLLTRKPSKTEEFGESYY